MALPVTNEPPHNLLWRHQDYIGNEITAYRMREVGVQHHARKVSAIVKEEIEMRYISSLVEKRYQLGIFFFTGLELEAIDLPVEGGTYQLSPLVPRDFIIAIGNKI
jgi:hypothetical protein